MKLAILIACGAVATVACASNKPVADQPTQASLAPEPVAPARPDDGYRPSEEARVHAADTATVDHPPPSEVDEAGSPPPRAIQDDTASNAPATIGTPAPTSQPDNTRVNKRDQSTGAPTPMDQGNGSSDLKITQQIRQAVVADGSLSFTAKNVKIITNNGKVTLRGPVNSEQERTSIVASARRVVGDTNVDNQLEVKK